MPDLAALKSWLGETTTTYDAELSSLLDRTIDAVEREFDWYFREPRAAIETINGTGLPDLWLRQPPTNGVTVRTRTGIGEDWETVAGADYENNGRRLTHTSRWTRGLLNYRILYSEGFDPMPGDIEQLILDLCAHRWKGRQNDPGMKSETIGDYSYTRADFEQVANWGQVKAHWKRGRI